jgi:hypothetical protein
MTHRIPLANGRGFALVDDDDAPLVAGYSWLLAPPRKPGWPAYARTILCQRPWRAVKMHVLLMGQPGIDHRNGDGLDNRRANLRVATQGQQLANQRPRAGGTSRYKGVYRHGGAWAASVTRAGQRRYLGRFTEEEEAARAYDAAAREQWGPFARLNFPT